MEAITLTTNQVNSTERLTREDGRNGGGGDGSGTDGATALAWSPATCK